MHTLLDAACRRTVGIAAGIVLAGGVAGGVLLTPGTAFASGTLSSSTSVSASQSGHGVTADVTVSNASATPGTAPTGSVTVTADGGSCTVTLAPHGGSASGSCTIGFVPDGTWTVTASYGGDANYAASSGTTSVTVNNGPGPGPGPGQHAPVFTADSPPVYATSGQSYGYTFPAVGSPPIRYSLSGPFWLHINPFDGTVSGTVPNFGGSFSYTVTATNNIGSTSRSFTVFVRQPFRQHHYNHSNVSTSLSCTSKVYSGQRGSCTLWVTEHGNGSASDVTAQIALPKQLQADYCGFLNFGCSIFNNTASENLGTLYPGQTKSLTVTFTARSASWLWGYNHRFAFTVKVVGSASSNGLFSNGFFGHSESYSTAYVTIIPRFF